MKLVDDDTLSELTRSVWEMLLGIDPVAREAGPPEHVAIVTSVDITGAWHGSISLSFPPALGPVLVSAMLACPEADATDSMVRDVVGELANVIGGNVKGLVPGPSVLSLPRVERSTQAEIVAGQCLWFDCAGHAFSVTVTNHPLQRTPHGVIGA